MRVRRLACLVVCAGALAGCSLRPGISHAGCRTSRHFRDRADGGRLPSGGASPDLWQWWRTLHDPQLNEPDRACARRTISISRSRSIVCSRRDCNSSCIGSAGAAGAQWRGRRRRRHRHRRDQGQGRAGLARRRQQHGSQEDHRRRRSRRRMGDRHLRQDRAPRRGAGLYRRGAQGGARLGLCRDRRRRHPSCISICGRGRIAFRFSIATSRPRARCSIWPRPASIAG